MVVNDWVKVKLGDVCSISAPMVDPRDSEYAYLPHIGNENIEKHSGLLLSYNKVIDDNLISGKYLFNKNDILYGKINPQFGKVAYPGFKGLCSADIYPISCGPYIIPEFLKYVLLSYSFLKYTVALSQRSGMPKVNREEVIKYEFSLPSIIEQQKIAKSLSDMDALIAKSEKFVKKYQALKQACLQHMFPREGQTEPDVRLPGFTAPWEQRKLGDYVTIISGDAPSKFDEGNELYVKVDDLNCNSKYVIDSKNKVALHESINKAPEGSVVFPKRGAAIMTNKVRILADDCYIDTNLMALSSNKIDSEFLYNIISKEGLYKIADTSTIPQINNKHIEPYEVLLPRLDEQRTIGKFFKDVDNLITLHQRTCNKYKKIKQGMMEELLSGKIRLV